MCIRDRQSTWGHVSFVKIGYLHFFSNMEVESLNTLQPGHLIVGREFPALTWVNAYIERLSMDILRAGADSNEQFNEEVQIQKGFIGSHPVTLTNRNLEEMSREQGNFLVCEKSDGVRFLMFVLSSGDVLLNGRKDEFQIVNLPLPRFYIDDMNDPDILHVFDGELVIDEYVSRRTGAMKRRLCFLIFDSLVKSEKQVFEKRYDERLSNAYDFVSSLQLDKRVARDLSPGQLYSNSLVTHLPKLKIRVKDFYRPGATSFLFSGVIASNFLPHENDGVIFTKVDAPYIVGRNNAILKWKPPERNSIDFIAVHTARDNDKPGLLELYVIKGRIQDPERPYSNLVFFDLIYLTQAQINQLNFKGDICIVECVFDFGAPTPPYVRDFYRENADPEALRQKVRYQTPRELLDRNVADHHYNMINQRSKDIFRGNWKILKVREDKTLPNAFGTAVSVFQSIKENITPKTIEDAIKNVVIRDGPMKRPRLN
eukprot:TRINITY_DN9831_c0_g1_i2.p1 TRINITY_DN9831_c0_g1~~TRINITY_DN9831_c0_g1_i2.p1  ORF type:complete len:484 (-),score=95.93 TRINITY_DN9831_c0_g1_i2:36-1487(-)